MHTSYFHCIHFVFLRHSLNKTHAVVTVAEVVATLVAAVIAVVAAATS